MPRWSNDVHVDPYSHLRHWRCVLDTAAEQRVSKQPPLLFSMYTPTPAAAVLRRPATFHATLLFQSVAARQVLPKRRFFLFFCFSSAPETNIFLLTRCSVTLPMSNRGGTCVIDAPRRCVGGVVHLIFIRDERVQHYLYLYLYLLTI